MINLIIAYDDKDLDLGTYFKDCKKQLLSILEEQNDPLKYKLNEISSDYCNNVYINSLMPQHMSNPFIFIAYSHGNEKALCCGNSCYIEKNVNTHYFKNSLFYTTACSTGKELGEDLINKGCLAFIGYKTEAIAFLEGSMKEISIKCDNAGITEYLSNDITIFEAFKKMKDCYTQQIDRVLNDNKLALFAATLVEARDSLVFFGKNELKKEDMFFS
jgi:hypothetical protein